MVNCPECGRNFHWVEISERVGGRVTCTACWTRFRVQVKAKRIEGLGDKLKRWIRQAKRKVKTWRRKQ